ncbi:putative DNA photolyase [Rhizoctonia solani AG-1 IA]|uniref:Putative DNA photolyase n=1 Tax=Thanatephorus cucumeris (strain AG1-IA) TaxID=983506 RepID=L8X5I5_THACA|nr:putative DNA photolyase [Rhizoctonia solani AG-1 IA]
MASKRSRAASAANKSSKKQKVMNDYIKKETKSTKRESSETKDELSSEVAYVQEVHGKIATAENAARVDDDPPLAKLQNAISDVYEPSTLHGTGSDFVSVRDNRAFSAASNVAQELGVPLVVLFILSPGDYTSHDRSPRRIDFCLRNLAALKETLGGMDIPLYVTSHTPRKTLPDEVIKLARKWNARRIYANIEYQVDELRRDIRLIHLATMASVRAEYFSDRCVVEPGALATKEGRDPSRLEESPTPKPNDNKTRNHPKVGDLFKCEIPESVEGFECHDRENMTLLYPAGEEAAHEVLRRFLYTKSRDSQLADASPLASGAEESSNHSRIKDYMNSRDHADADTTSRISPYLASGVISARECVRGAMKILGVKRVDAGKTSGPGVWVSEIGELRTKWHENRTLLTEFSAWRDFYTHVMAAFPRVSMGRPFQEKFADVKWETNAAHLKAWKEGKTGVPIVDAIRQANTQGWMHNRARMITAMYLTKDLMLDWRLGEKHFMEQFIDGDLASNNGGWQWSASTGTDPQPYFRIFNPYSQSEKADPKGEQPGRDYIKYFVPELKDLSGKALHDPYGHLSPSEFKKLGYPKPLVDHKEARERALRRYKNPGEK